MRKRWNSFPTIGVATLAAFVLLAHVASAGPIPSFVQTNMVSNIPGLAAVTDPQMQNPWGVSESAASPFWVSDNATGLATLYNSAGVKQGLVVTIPWGAPTGQVFNTGGSSMFNGDSFLFASENGYITGWRGALGANAETLVDDSASGANFKGIALGATQGVTYAYAADFRNNKIEVIPGTSGAPVLGNFSDPNMPAGYAPFNIQNIGGELYVMYAKQDSTGSDEIPGAGNGYVDVFDLNGNLIRRLVSNGPLNAPWGIALAPAGFGSLGNDLLIGNFGDGTINAFDLNGSFLGTLADVNGNILQNDGLWALTFGNGGNGGSKNSLYFTAGLNDEADGLFGRIDVQPVPEPGTFALLGLGMALLLKSRRTRL
jgi:uncharacterized protein (TIGR03118 family)